MMKEDLKPFKFYHWIERSTNSSNYMEDICFIFRIDKTSTSDSYQCGGMELENIHSDLHRGNGYNYHYYFHEPKLYTIKEISFKSIDRGYFFDKIFDIKSSLNTSLWIYRND